jgi:hypothetical protein
VGGAPRRDQGERRPPGVPEQHDRPRDAGAEVDQPGRDEGQVDLHRRALVTAVELPGHGDVAGQRGVLQVADARRFHARVGEVVVEPRRRPVAEALADGLVERRGDLAEHEHQAHRDQRTRLDEPPWTAPMTRPVVTANTGGSTARSTTSPHHAAASGRPARDRWAKNCHS